MVYLRKRIGPIDWARISTSLARVVAASVAMGVLVYVLSHLWAWDKASPAFQRVLVLALCVLAGGFAYTVSSLLLKSEEALFLISVIRERVRRSDLD